MTKLQTPVGVHELTKRDEVVL